MQKDFYSSVLDGLHGINMTMRQRARAEAGMRASAAIMEMLVGMAGLVGLRSKQTEAR
jgi:hypothetical protein